MITEQTIIYLWLKGLMPQQISEETCLDIKLVEEIIESEAYYEDIK